MSDIVIKTTTGVSIQTEEWNRIKALADAALTHLRVNDEFNRAIRIKDRAAFQVLQDNEALAVSWDALVAAGRAFEPLEDA